MIKKILLLFFCLLPFVLSAQVFPAEGDSVSYRLIGFSSPASAKATGGYRIEVAKCKCSTESDFNKNKIKTISTAGSKVVAEVPAFGAEYTWRYASVKNKAVSKYSTLNHFSTGFSSLVDTARVRLKINRTTKKHDGTYIIKDGGAVIYDINGLPVWYAPEKLNLNGDKLDIKISPDGTITFISGGEAYEISYNGNILWKAPFVTAPDSSRSEVYHHEFVKLANGHYMVLAIDTASVKVNRDKSAQGESKSFFMVKASFGKIIEYNAQGQILWTWKTTKYLKESDLINYQPGEQAVLDLHENAFFFDEQSKILYLSFKNINRIIKVKYPEGNVITSYGQKYEEGRIEQGAKLFCGQHACKYSQVGCLFLFNNNGCNIGQLPKVKMIKEDARKKNGMKKIWEYQCSILDDNNDRKHNFSGGGNVVEMPGDELFVSMGGDYGKMFIVNKNKNELWSGVPEKLDAVNNKWTPTAQYRSNIITDKKILEKLVMYGH